ncbi:hypothetical protein KJ359_006347 [Pestalotiopsis sp. 9143b]|nr:hypothetical protein KJ359_006347 [Pestalotiopsis sp. 9143b]
MAAAAGIIDPTKVGKYPVVLSDALLGKRSSEVYTGVKYNHRPDVPPDSAKLRPNVTFKGSYDLLYGEKGNIHKYRGNRTSNENQYVLIFDPKREVFVLHKVDSTFNMNLTQTPENKNAESLKKEYPHLPNSGAEGSTTKAKGKAGASQGTKAQKKAPPKPSKPAAPEKRKNASDDEEESDNNDVLEIDFGDTAAPNRDFSPAFPPRRFSEFNAHDEEDDEDADGEEEDEEMSEQEHFPLPSPVVPQQVIETVPNNTISLTFDDDSSASEEDEEPAPAPAPVQQQQEQEDDDDIDMEDDLAAAIEAELAGADSESDVSEED